MFGIYNTNNLVLTQNLTITFYKNHMEIRALQLHNDLDTALKNDYYNYYKL